MPDGPLPNSASAYPERPERAWRSGSIQSCPAFRLVGRHRLETPAKVLRAIRKLPPERLDLSQAEALRPLLRGLSLHVNDLIQTLHSFRNISQQTLGLRPHDVQLAAAFHMLDGTAVEMETGEGKTLTAALVAAAHALAGRSVHVVTTNDYLAARDEEALRPFYSAVGLRSCAVLGAMTDAQRRDGYAAEIVYVTAKNLMFDYLRDRIALGNRAAGALRRELAARRAESGMAPPLFLRGLQVAIVDEADSIFIDDAAVPLIISQSRPVPEQADIAHSALRFAQMLENGRDYVLQTGQRQVRLTDAGRARLAAISPASGAVFANPRWREHYVSQALAALLLFVRDRDYIIQNDAIQTVDAGTGRAMPDRSWERGLHQMIQAKENLPMTVPSEAAARISHLAFFRRYNWLTGMSGTLLEARREIRLGYGLDVVRIPTNKPLRRRNHGTRVFSDQMRRMAALVQRAKTLQMQGRPILIGTRSVKQSEVISRGLAAAGIVHRLLNARSEPEEATIIAEAGTAGQVTVSTAIAGRGTDIRLDAVATAAGGLHVIATERHEARRIDRQLFGRCGRQGDPGSFEEMLSLEDELLVRHLPRALARFGQSMPVDAVRSRLFALAQSRSERHARRIRAEFGRAEREADGALAFAGSFTELKPAN